MSHEKYLVLLAILYIYGVVLSPECKFSPISKSGLEIILNVKFSIEESCSNVLKRLKELIDEYYDPVSVQRPSKPTEAPELEAKDSSTEMLEHDDEFVIFIDDSENEEEDV